MLYNLLAPMAESVQALNLLNYITFRAGAALMTAIILSFALGAPMIKWLRSKQGKGQPIRDDGPERHLIEKAGTPTMGGLLILIALVLSTFLWADLANEYIWIVLFVTIGFGIIGFIDDYTKVSKHSTAGLGGKMKLLAEFLIAGIAVWWMIEFAPIAAERMDVGVPDGFETSLTFPFFKDLRIDLGGLYTLTIGSFDLSSLPYIAFGMIVIVGAANAVNLTDGLDGLAIGPVMIAGASFGFICYITGSPRFADYLFLINTPGSAELAVFFAGLLGAGLGFLWFNAPPAKIFMGDTGSLALGGAIGASAVAVKHEIVLVIIGGLFVLEAVSVIVQVASFKLTGKRVFRMAPIHHHFEKMGWAEPTIVIRFWIISIILALIGLATLKLR